MLKKRVIYIVAIILVSAFVLVVFGSYNPTRARLHYARGIEVKKADCYVDNVLMESVSDADFTKDVKMVYYTDDGMRLVDFAGGYYLDLHSSTFDFSKSANHIEITDDKTKTVVNIEKDYSPYDDIWYYIDHYNMRFITSDSYHKGNNMSVLRSETFDEGKSKVFTLTRQTPDDSALYHDTYTYVYFTDNTRYYWRIMIKQKGYDEDYINGIIENFTPISATGKKHYSIDTAFVYPDCWNEETRQAFDDIKNAENITKWGAYVPLALSEDGIAEGFFELEEKVDYDFDIVMGYTYLNPHAPIKSMQQAYDAGKICELTLQISTPDNKGLDGMTPVFEILDGKHDETLRSFARELREFSHPFMFRLNNEMNTDWTSYCGMTTLADPEIYKTLWRYIYDIFSQEGVDNAIWIFNPQYGNYPPANWNDYLNYYPGSEYVQLFGVTAYNTGTFYLELYNEQWNEFSALYQPLEDLYSKHFGDWPWIITEFGSSSIGGDKPKWITSMFTEIKKIPNIKAAVWFNADDYLDEEAGIIERPYRLDETEETTKAFAEGIREYKK